MTQACGIGSFKVEQFENGEPAESANYSTFIGCWTEGADPTDFSKASNVLVLGGNLAGFANGPNGAKQRVGYLNSKLLFQDSVAVGEADQRGITVQIPEFHPNGFSPLTFKYQPLQEGRQIWNSIEKKWVLDPYGSEINTHSPAASAARAASFKRLYLK